MGLLEDRYAREEKLLGESWGKVRSTEIGTPEHLEAFSRHLDIANGFAPNEEIDDQFYTQDISGGCLCYG